MNEPQTTDEPQLYTLTVTEAQARTLSRALNVWGRALGGQLDHVGQEVQRWSLAPYPGSDASQAARDAHNAKWDRFQLLATLLRGLNVLITGYDNPGAGHGIYSEEMPEEAKVAYDLDKAIRRCLWEAQGREPSYSVDGEPPLLAGREPLALVQPAPAGIHLESGRRFTRVESGRRETKS